MCEATMDLCRICDKRSTKIYDIFSKNADGKQILQLIRESLPVVIYRNDPLSKQICVECLENITRITSFRKHCLEVLNKHKDKLKGDPSKDALLYVQLLENTDQQELWMYSSPIKKSFGKEVPLCPSCKTEMSTPKTPKPFRKYKEAIRKVDADSPLLSVNGHMEDDCVEVHESCRKRKLPSVDKSSITYGSVPKRMRIFGPKSISQPFIKSTFTETTVYNPLSLLSLSLNVINKQFVPSLICEHYEEGTRILEEIEYICEYCSEIFDDEQDLAKHEVKHMKINLTKVDNLEVWKPSFEAADVRNKWLRETIDDDYIVDDDDEDSENLLMPLVETETGNESSTGDGEIELVDTKPMVNGVYLADLPKAERKTYYNKSFTVAGVKRKFCPLCRYTFKDNWAIELHYFSSACYYTCRYCGVRFNKQRAQFDEHVNQHIDAGDRLTDKVFASKKKNDPIPRVLNSKMTRASFNASPQNNSAPKVKPIKMKQLFEKSNISSSPVNSNSETSPSQSQAYFCRKCYKVFFKLDEFNQHTTICEGVPKEEDMMEEKHEPRRKYQRPPPTNYEEPRRPSVGNDQSDTPRTVSSAGRPIRNCVRDVKYRDHLDADIETDGYGNYECKICNAIFPTIPSRNSHMRIHNAHQYPSQEQMKMKYAQNSTYNNSYSSYDDSPIKQEPLEPLVEIHETNSSHDIPSNIGAVSITPIPNKRHKTSINPDIIKLVQSNPNITIRSVNHNLNSMEPETLLTESTSDEIRSYKCSSCSKAFTNKSNLYFHKKNHCQGSRYPCPFCKKRFGTETAYSSHIFYSHPE